MPLPAYLDPQPSTWHLSTLLVPGIRASSLRTSSRVQVEQPQTFHQQNLNGRGAEQAGLVECLLSCQFLGQCGLQSLNTGVVSAVLGQWWSDRENTGRGAGQAGLVEFVIKGICSISPVL